MVHCSLLLCCVAVSNVGKLFLFCLQHIIKYCAVLFFASSTTLFREIVSFNPVGRCNFAEIFLFLFFVLLLCAFGSSFGLSTQL